MGGSPCRSVHHSPEVMATGVYICIQEAEKEKHCSLPLFYSIQDPSHTMVPLTSHLSLPDVDTPLYTWVSLCPVRQMIRINNARMVVLGSQAHSVEPPVSFASPCRLGVLPLSITCFQRENTFHVLNAASQNTEIQPVIKGNHLCRVISRNF